MSIAAVPTGALASSLEEDALSNTVVLATFVDADEQSLTFDLGQDRKAQVAREEFAQELPFSPGQEVPILVEELRGDAWMASFKKAEKLAIWDSVDALVKSGEPVEGFITAENKGGLSVDIGLRAFLPRSQIDLHPVNDVSPYLGRKDRFIITKFDKRRGQLVVSRRRVLEREQKAERRELLDTLAVGQKFEGVVRNIKEYGAFVDIGGLDGLLHITNMSWGRVDHPSELFRPGDKVEVVVLSWDPKKKRLGLGRKQLLDDPWTDVESRFEQGQILEGEVVSLADFGAFVAIAPGLEGLVHVTELSWTRRINHPKEVLNLGQEVKVKILSLDSENRRLSLSIKQLEENPWVKVAEQYPVGTRVTGPIRNITDFGLFVEVEKGVEGLVHISDLSWTEKIDQPSKHYKTGQEVEVVVLDIDVESQRMGLGIKQLEENPWELAEKIAVPGQKIEVRITRLTEFGAFAEIVKGVEGLIHISELSEERVNQASEIVRPDETLEALVMSFDRANERIGLSLKRDELEVEESLEREYSDDAEAAATTLGDIFRDRLGLSLEQEEEPAQEPEIQEEKAAEASEESEPPAAEQDEEEQED